MIIIKIKAGLGNQLFQYATARALTIRYKTELKLDLSFYKNPKDCKAYRLDKFQLPLTIAKASDYNHLKNISNSIIPKVLKKIGIKVYPYYKKTHVVENDVITLFESKNELNRDYYIEGWLANENYFKEYREIIVNDLNADHFLMGENLLLQQEIKNTNSVAVHIRRGDYLTNSYFKSLPKEYYQRSIRQAMNEIDNSIFYFFSNDVVWTQNEFSNIPNAKFIVNNSIADTDYSTTGDIADLMLMRSCKHQIIANSTFSWWGAWLNKNPAKLVYYPALWYNDLKAQEQFESNSFIPSDWIKVQF